MAKVIMVQGTMSNAGKSFLVAGLCRIFKQDGYRVAPFKSQNMALNSFITEEGLEMGRAQVMQAEAAGIRPLVCMNPILLKPTNHTGSQVIVNGEVLGNMSARDYFAFKKKLIPDTDFGEIQMEFTFDATKLKGEQVVVFEEVYLEEKLVAAHADLEDEGQSVTYKKEKQVEEEKPESPEKPKETEKAKTVATGDGSYVKILVFLIGVILTGALLLCFLLSRMWGRMWKRR